jgi:hypothetical protein
MGGDRMKYIGICECCEVTFETRSTDATMCSACKEHWQQAATPKTTEKQLLPHEIYEAGKLEGEGALKWLVDRICKEGDCNNCPLNYGHSPCVLLGIDEKKCTKDYFINKTKEGEG